MRHAVLALVLIACGTTDPLLTVDVVTDLVPGVAFASVRTELSAAPFGEGPLNVQQIERVATASEDFGAGVRVAEIRPLSSGLSYLRVTLADASGRIRGQRLATVDVGGVRSVTIVISSACNGVVCPESGDPDDATACVNGACVAATCTPEDPETCPPIGCAGDEECAAGFACHRAACASGSCLLLDACPAGQVCTEAGCAPLPACGDGSCDAGSETACACTADCGACAASCGDGACGAGELAETCPEDCGPPPSVCGDQICEVGESCAADCPGAPPPACGDAGCTSCEQCDACCDQGCGDGACNEPPGDCPLDCGPPPIVCGDTRCDLGESCAADCRGPICGDRVCSDGAGESCGNCQLDCGWCGFGLPTVRSLRSCIGASGYGLGRTCGDLSSAWTDSADNVAYYPMVTSRTTPLVTGEESGQLLLMLPPLTTVAIQSTRNPLCHDSPPLRASIQGWVFGYVRGASSSTTGIGWMRAADLLLDLSGGPCANGPADGAFQVATNPYSRSPICEHFDCDGERRCRDINPLGEGAIECEGEVVDYERIVDVDALVVRYSPAGTPRRFLHRGDRVRVRYESPDRDSVYVIARTTSAPTLSPVGAPGWVSAGSLRAP
jgi:hypothetical protein